MLAITNCTIVMKDHYIPNGAILTQNGKIIDFGKNIPIPDEAKVLNANGNFAGPGLVDIHTHAAGEDYFHLEPEKCCKMLLEHGVTSVLPALYYSLNKKEHLDAIKNIKNCMQNGKGKNIAGIYMEGPYLNPDYGCDREKNAWKDGIIKENYAEILENARDIARVWCVSPEIEGTLDFVKDVKSQIPDIVFSVAHSTATPEQIEEIMPYGLKLATHHTNATGTLQNFPECRTACVDETVNYNGDIYAELICDSMGIHVQPYMLRLIRKIKGENRIILISDALVADGPPIPGCEEAFDINFDHSGEIAGSKLTLDIACRNMMTHTGASVCDVFRYASTNPAKLVNLTTKGEIRKGNDADLVIVDPWFNIKNTILKGEIIK